MFLFDRAAPEPEAEHFVAPVRLGDFGGRRRNTSLFLFDQVPVRRGTFLASQGPVRRTGFPSRALSGLEPKPDALVFSSTPCNRGRTSHAFGKGQAGRGRILA
ncbi:hypothetical protein B9G55_10200 [Saccharibacillus sp. O16]|nr:hypothetical protein B9G55_10200 [Saccharibacillus sp. O16]